jgi:hypothetical protein
VSNNNWKKIEAKMDASRGKNDSYKTAEDCKRRWMTLTKGMEYKWTPEADDKLIELVSTKGKNWAMFSKYFDGLHKDKIRHRYTKLEKEGRFPSNFGKLNFPLTTFLDEIDQGRRKKCRILFAQNSKGFQDSRVSQGGDILSYEDSMYITSLKGDECNSRLSQYFKGGVEFHTVQTREKQMPIYYRALNAIL